MQTDVSGPADNDFQRCNLITQLIFSGSCGYWIMSEYVCVYLFWKGFISTVTASSTLSPLILCSSTIWLSSFTSASEHVCIFICFCFCKRSRDTTLCWTPSYTSYSLKWHGKILACFPDTVKHGWTEIQGKQLMTSGRLARLLPVPTWQPNRGGLTSV